MKGTPQSADKGANPRDRLLTEREAAEMLGSSAATLNVWRCRGTGPDLPWIKLGRAVRYRMGDVLDCLERNTRRHAQ